MPGTDLRLTIDADLQLAIEQEVLAASVADAALGVSAVPINADLRSAELEYLIAHSEIALAVALPERHDALRAAARAAA